jgi:hypothetical protein
LSERSRLLLEVWPESVVATVDVADQRLHLTLGEDLVAEFPDGVR